MAYSGLVADLRAVFRSGRTKDMEFRKQQLHGLLRMIDENKSEMIHALYKDLRKPKNEAVAFEIDFSRNDLVECINEIDKWAAPEHIPKTLLTLLDKAYLKPEPYGVALILGAWNYPIQLAVCPLIGAIAAGNCALLKPSEISPATAELMERLVPRYLDSDCYKVVNGGVPETTAILKERFDYIFYTGNPAVGRIVMEAAAKFLTPVTLELGGKNPTYIAPDCDIKIAARRIAWGKWANCGQTCIAPDYLLVDKITQGKFVEELKKVVEEYFGKNPKESPDYTRLVNKKHFNRVRNLMTNGKVLLGGDIDEDDNYISPTVMTGFDASDVALQEEIFGPVLITISVDTLDEAIEYINDREKPLALYGFINKSDKPSMQKVIDSTSSGAVVINDTMVQASLSAFPFGGVGQSGLGGYHGKWSFDTFSHKKPCLVKRDLMIEKLNDVRYPPYNEKKLKAVATILNQKLKGSGMMKTIVLYSAAAVVFGIILKWFGWSIFSIFQHE